MSRLTGSIWDRVTNVEALRKEIKRLEAELKRAQAKAAGK